MFYVHGRMSIGDVADDSGEIERGGNDVVSVMKVLEIIPSCPVGGECRR